MRANYRGYALGNITSLSSSGRYHINPQLAAHLHLVPLHGSNELFDPKKVSKGKPEDLKNVQEKLKNVLDSI